MISELIIRAILQTGVLAFAIPIVVLAVWKMRTRKSLVPFFVGALIFVVFAKVLEMAPHTLFVLTDNPISRVVKGNVVIYALYGGLAAGIFEEVGRYIAFRFLLKNHVSKETAVTYGIGHGGIECMLVLGVGYLQYYSYALLMNNGTIQKSLDAYKGNPAALKSFQSMIDSIKEITYTTCYMAGWERVSAMLLQIGLSILVFQAVRVAGKKYMLLVAILLHAAADFPAAFYQSGDLALLPAELIIFGIALAVFIFSIYTYIYMDIPEDENSASKVTAKQHELHKIANQRLKDLDSDKK